MSNEIIPRKVFSFYTYLKNYCIEKNIWDIIFSENDYPYLVDWPECIYEIDLKVKDKIDETKVIEKKIWIKDLFIKNFWEQPLTSSDMNLFFDELQKYSILPNLKEKFKKDKWVDFAIKLEGRKIRVNIWNKLWEQIEVVSRILPEPWNAPTLEWLKLITESNQIYKNITKNKEWLILVVWPTGSWKSTTLVAMINEVNETSKRRILSFEDPIEYEHINKKSKIVQKEVGVDIKDYAQWLHLALRQKPHIAVVWEIRDAEVMQLSMELCSTWHMVMSTFHAKTVTQTISRIEKMYPESEREWMLADLADMLLWIFVQRLLPKKWGWKILLREIIIWTQAVKRAIAKRDFDLINWLMKEWSSDYMIDTDSALNELYNQWLITEETLFNYAIDKKWAEKITWISY